MYVFCSINASYNSKCKNNILYFIRRISPCLLITVIYVNRNEENNYYYIFFFTLWATRSMVNLWKTAVSILPAIVLGLPLILPGSDNVSVTHL